MPDRFGPRGTLALFSPLQNANMQPEYELLRPEGINNQIYRFTLEVPDKVLDAILRVVEGGLGCWPDQVIIENNVEMRVWTPDQHAEYRGKLQEAIGNIPLVTATDAAVAALKTMGANLPRKRTWLPRRPLTAALPRSAATAGIHKRAFI
jgi:maleate isomerase